MPGYQLALFVHLLAMLGATVFSTVVHLAMARRARAATTRVALEWHDVATNAAKGFPIALVSLVLTGWYMVGSRFQWRAGFVVAGVVGALLLVVHGAILGAKGRALRAALVERIDAGGAEQPPMMRPDPVAPMLASANHGIALGVVFAMVAKPGIAGSLGAVAAGIAVMLLVARASLPRPAVRPTIA